jgi:acetyl esterase/lipase
LNAKKVYDIDWKKLILTGDSAGGNLCIVMTLMAINRKFKRPDFLMPMYPTTISSKEVFWPSMLNSFDDIILSYTMLHLMMGSYSPKSSEHRFLGTHNQYMSPGLCASDECLGQFPITRLFLAGVDPLKDDGVNFLFRLLKNKVNVKGFDFRLMPHGFLSYTFPVKGMEESRKSVEITGECLWKMANGEEF